jgi:transcriptional regulator with XRE-family HTH domain
MPSMIVSSRVEEKMKERGFTQSELARRVGVTQPSIYKLLRSSKKGSTHLHRIASVLGTTPAYLSGETDDPNDNAPFQSILDPETRELIDQFSGLSPADRRALLQVAKSMAGPKPSETVHPPPPAYKDGLPEQSNAANPAADSSDTE